jgi:hypothetical protein
MTTENHSLEPDMIFGWKPKNLEQGGPIPLSFDKDYLPVRKVPYSNAEYVTIFNGFWPKDTLVLHRTYTNENSYEF